MARTRRRSYEPGHRPKYLIVVDETPEWDRALYFAARRCARIGAAMLTLFVIVPEQETQGWAGVEEIMRQEAEEKAQALLAKAGDRARAVAGIEPESLIREGQQTDVIAKVIEEDEDISILVLAAGVGAEGPGPLVASLAAKGAKPFIIPVTIVPGGLDDGELDALT